MRGAEQLGGVLGGRWGQGRGGPGGAGHQGHGLLEVGVVPLRHRRRHHPALQAHHDAAAKLHVHRGE